MSSNEWQAPPASSLASSGYTIPSVASGGSPSAQQTVTTVRTLKCIPVPNATFDHQAHYDTLDEDTKDAIDCLSGTVDADRTAINASKPWVARVKAEKDAYRASPKEWDPSLATVKEFSRFAQTLNTVADFKWNAGSNNNLYLNWIAADGPLAEIIDRTFHLYGSNMNGELQELSDMMEREGYDHVPGKSDICDSAQTYEAIVTRMEAERAQRTGSLGETDDQLKLSRDNLNDLAFRELMVKGFHKANRSVARRAR